MAQPRLLAVGHAHEIKFNHDLVGGGPRTALRERIPRFQEIVRLQRPERVQAQPAETFGKRPLVCARLIITFPLRRPVGLVEFIVGLRRYHWCAFHRHFPRQDHIADSIGADPANDRPALNPRNRQRARAMAFPIAAAMMCEPIPVAIFSLH